MFDIALYDHIFLLIGAIVAAVVGGILLWRLPH